MLFFVFFGVTRKKGAKNSGAMERAAGCHQTYICTGYGKWPPVELICSQQFSFAIGSNTHFCRWQLIYISTDMLWRHEEWGNTTANTHTFFPLPIVAVDLKIYHPLIHVYMAKMNASGVTQWEWNIWRPMAQPTPPPIIAPKNRHQQIISMAFDIHAVCLSLRLYVSVDVTNYDLSNILVSGERVWECEWKSTSFSSDSSVFVCVWPVRWCDFTQWAIIFACRIHRCTLWKSVCMLVTFSMFNQQRSFSI